MHFARSMNADFVDSGFDLFLRDIGNNYLVLVGTTALDGGNSMLVSEPNTSTPALSLRAFFAAVSLTNLSIASNFVPAVHNAYDLGTAGVRWRDLYLGRNLYIAGKVNSSLEPGTDVEYDLGSATYRWRNLYAHGEGSVDVDSVSAPSILGGNMPPRDRNGDVFGFDQISSEAFWRAD